jgi:exodeoxyribonuclease V beta subunit
LLEQRLPVQGILVVTFTNAATAELRERIRSRIAETLAQLRGTGPAQADVFVDALLHSLRHQHGLDDADMALRLELALHSFDEASIFTIHGFCQRALADAPFSTAMPLALTLLPDDSAMLLDVVHDFWRRHIAGPGLTPALAAALLDAKDTPQSLAALLKRRIAKPLSRLCWPDVAEDAPAGLPGVDAGDAALADALADARASWRSERERIVGIVVEALPRLSKLQYNAEALQKAAAQWEATLLAGDGFAIPAK